MEDGFELKAGKLVLRVNPGQMVKVKALGKVYMIKAPASKVAEATIIIKNNTVKVAGLVPMSGSASAADPAPSYLGPALLAGAAVAGVAAVAASESNKGGGGVASPSTP